MTAVGSKKNLPGYKHPLKLAQDDIDPVVQEIVNTFDDTQSLVGNSGVGLVALHLGAGYHSPDRWPAYKKLCENALTAAVEHLKNKGTAGEAATIAVKILENSEMTNAGFGSNLTESGQIECDASVMDTSVAESQAGSVTYGSVSCVNQIKNPVEAAFMISLQQAKQRKLSLGRILPCSMSGTGAENWARAHNVEMCDRNSLISESAYKTWQKYQRRLTEQILRKRKADSNVEVSDLSDADNVNDEVNENHSKHRKLDTVGAIALDFYGKVAAAASSGGLLMKLPGRVGQAATFGCGCWAEVGRGEKPTVAVTSTGCGEQLVYTTIAKKCAENLQSKGEPYQAVQDTLLNDFLGSPFLSPEADRQAGLLTLHLSKNEDQVSTEVVWGHTTSSFLIGHMSTRDNKPEVLVSRLPENAVAGKSVSVSGTWIKVSSERTEEDGSDSGKSPTQAEEDTVISNDVQSGQLDGNYETDKNLIMWMSDTIDGLTVDECGVNLSNNFNRKVDENFEKLIEKRWEERKRKNPRLFNGLKFRIHSLSTPKDGPKRLIFNIGLTCYRDYMETNWAEEVKELKLMGQKSHDCEDDFFAHPLGVAGVVLTSDNHVILQRRNHWLAEAAGMLDVPGGHPEPNEVQPDVTICSDVAEMKPTDVTAEIFSSQLKEVRDEVNVALEHLGQPKLIGVVRNGKSARRPVAHYIIRCALPANQVEELYKKGGAETDESTQLLFLPEKDAVYLERDSPDLWCQVCENGKAAITLYSVLYQRKQGLEPFQDF
uniref:Uncharacterized protein LOC100178578 n=1 Tax=Phallusia mammillata TaxID=59560 RepID=A0A6F9DHK7_9ASCI|nr:uncharacterized protein LOC100178578 [Phallusia mammillata]